MTCRLALVWLVPWLGPGGAATAAPGPAARPRLTHPLMPGVRCTELWNRDWPRTLHDKQLTGFSPLVCGMKRAPKVWASLDTGGELRWVRQVTTRTGERVILVNDGRLRAVTPTGRVLWTSREWGALIYFGDLRGNGRDYVLVGVGPRLSVLDAATGKTEWVHVFQPAYLVTRVQVGDVFPDRPGLEAVVFFQYGDEGCLLSFPPRGRPQFIWRRKVVAAGEHPERADHGCDIRLDLTDPARPLVWNVRHHRCRGFDARTGEQVSSLVYNIGGGHRRNYGPWGFAGDGNGNRFAVVVGEAIQTHVHAIRLNRNGPSELAWQHYYGEVYVTPGVAVKRVALADMDGDGVTELVYNVRDPDHDFRSFVRVRDATTGKVEVELPEAWCGAAFFDVGAAHTNGLLTFTAPRGAMPDGGRLTVRRFAGDGKLTTAGVVAGARLPGLVTVPGTKGNELLIRHPTPAGKQVLTRYTLQRGRLTATAETGAPALVKANLRAVVPQPGGEQAFLATGARGTLQCLMEDGKRLWEMPLAGGVPPTLSAADLDGDGRAELVATTAGHRVRVFSLTDAGAFSQRAEYEFFGVRRRQSPLLYDLEGNGRLCLIAPGTTGSGTLTVRAFRADGSLLWKTPLDFSTAQGGTAVAWNAGEFLPGPRPRPGVAVSVGNARRTREGTYLLDGRTGKVRWFRDQFHDGNAVRGCVPVGLPSAYDCDGDGVEEIGMDLYSYLAYLRGGDGSFALRYHTRNIRADNALWAGLLYHSFSPVFAAATAEKPHWLITLGHGELGLLNPDPTTGVWKETLGYDMPERVGMVDVDGDGVMEVGYAVRNRPVFKCRDLWTGKVEWQLRLPTPVYGPVLTADVDGDGKGEFLAGSYCLGTNTAGAGELRWTSPVSLGWSILADFDGDGYGEIAVPVQGGIRVLKGNP